MEPKKNVMHPARRYPLRAINYANFLLDCLVAHWVNPAETVVISGFRRSGTTWLHQSVAEILDAKTVFEPLGPAIPELKELYRTWPIAHQRVGMLELYMPYWASSGQINGPVPHDGFTGFIQKALAGSLDSWWSRKVRRPNTSWKPRVVLKFTRGHLCVRAVHNHFACPTIHLTRDPRAILASIKMTPWGSRVFENLSLQQQLLDQEDGRTDYFDQWKALILQYDQRDIASRIAAYWALSESYVRHSVNDDPPRFRLLRYEDLVLQPSLMIDTLDALKVGTSGRRKPGFMRDDSKTTVPQRRGISIEERVFGWRKNLSRSEIEMIDQVAADFGLTETLVDQ